MKGYNKPLPDRANLRAVEAKIHIWLKNNRVGYNADKWAELVGNYSNKGEFSIPLPPEANQILTTEESNGILTNLPDTWYDKHEGEI